VRAVVEADADDLVRVGKRRKQRGPGDGRCIGSLEAVPQLLDASIGDQLPDAGLLDAEDLSRVEYPRRSQRASPCRATGAVRHQSHGGHPIPSGSGKDLFVHFSSIDGDCYRALNDGARVSYQSMEGPKGRVATNVSELSG
jgi:CspA family cold shock protein